MSIDTTLDLFASNTTMIESGINQLAHPNPHIRARLVEHSVSGCPNGCKYYQDPKTKVIVLAHSASYGCRRTKIQIQREKDELEFSGRNVWMVPMKDRFDQDVWDELVMRTASNLFVKTNASLRDAFQTMGDSFKTFAKSVGDVAESLVKTSD